MACRWLGGRRGSLVVCGVLVVALGVAACQGVAPVRAAGSAAVVSLDRDDLVKEPFRIGQYVADLSGSATAGYQTGGVPDNGDGTNTGINVTVPQWTTAVPGVRIWLTFYGETFGLRWKPTSVVGQLAVSVTVDGASVRVPTADIYLTQEGKTLVDGECQQVTHRGLGSGRHHAAITIAAPLSGGSQSVMLYGYLVRRGAGYEPPARSHGILSQGTLTTGGVTLSTLLNSQRAVSQVWLANTDAGAAHVVTVKYGAAVGWQRSVAINGTEVLSFTPALNPAAASGITILADANTSVNYLIIGGN